MHRPRLIAIFGPTAVGKTAVAVELGERLRAQGHDPIAISADALAVYREIPIMTGAPTRDQLDRLEHRLVGIRSVSEEFSAGEFAALAHAAIDGALAEGRTPILVGGTGLYLRAAVSALDLRSPVPEPIRARWQARLESEGATVLHSLLEYSRPDVAARIEPADGRRIIRALELLEIGEEPPAPSAGLWETPPRVPTIALGLNRDPEEHRTRVAERARTMLEAGATAEARAAESLGPSRTARAAIGWSELLVGDEQALVTRTWQLVRRQRTWMRRMGDVRVLDITGLDDAAAAELAHSALDEAAADEQRS